MCGHWISTWLAEWSANDWPEIFLNAWDWQISPNLCWGALCLYWGMLSTLSQAVWNFALAFTSYLHKISRSARGESWGPPPILSVHVHSPEHTNCLRHCAWTYRFPGKYQSFWMPRWNFIPQLLFSRLFGYSIVCLNCYTLPQASVKVSNGL